MPINWINLYILPVICIIGIIFELVCTITFYKINSSRNRRQKPIKIYQYLFLYSISDIIILCINFIYAVFNCGHYCQIGLYLSEHFIKQYERFGKIFVCNTLYTFNVLIELKIACDRYHRVVELKRLGSVRINSYGRMPHAECLGSSKTIGIILMSISAIINLPYIYIFKIDTDSDLLKPDLEAISHHPAWIKLAAIAYFLKDFLCLVFVCTFNLLLYIALRKNRIEIPKQNNACQKENALPDAESRILNRMSNHFSSFYNRKERRVSKMILFLSALFLIGHLPETFYRIKRKLSVLFFTDFNYLSYYMIGSNIISFVSSYFNLLIYLYFSKTFLEQFKRSFLGVVSFQSNARPT